MKEDKILFLKGAALLITLISSKESERYATKLSKITRLGYARVSQLLHLFEKINLIEKIMTNGRTKKIKLTKKGRDVAINLIFIHKILTT